MKKPFFSVVIPTFNQSNYLKVALESVFNQTFKNFEVIVVDNYSRDSTSKVIKKFKKQIIYKKIKNRGIIAKSRNLGIKLAKGKWIAFLDSDDYWSKNKLEKIYNTIQENKFDVICNSEWIIYTGKKKEKIWSYGPNTNNLYEKILKYGNRNSTSASIVRKSFLNRFKISFNEKNSFVTCEDYCFFLDIAYFQGRFLYLDEPLGTHRFHSKSYSYNKKKHYKSGKEVIKHHVFKIQSFEPNKEKLWSLINDNLLIKETFFNFLNLYTKKENLISFIKLLINKPFKTINYILSLFFKALKQVIIYYIYISKKNH